MNPPRPHPLPADAESRSRAAAILALAFGDDPVARHVDADPVRRAPATRAIFGRLLAGTGDPLSVEVAGEPMAGVAVWLPPAASTGPETDLWANLTLPHAGQLDRFREAIGTLDAAHAAAFRDPHWYLLFVGTDPHRTHRGVGGSLVRAHDADADAAGIECGLEAFGDDLRRFYEHLGWEVVATSRVAYSPEPLHSMRRRPRPR